MSRQKIESKIDKLLEKDLFYGVNSIEEEKKLLNQLKRKVLLKSFNTDNISDDKLNEFIFTREKASLNWDEFFYRTGLHYQPKFIYNDLIHKIYDLHMFNYDNLFLFKQYYDKLYRTEFLKIVPNELKNVVEKGLFDYFELDGLDPFTSLNREELVKYLLFYKNTKLYDIQNEKRDN